MRTAFLCAASAALVLFLAPGRVGADDAAPDLAQLFEVGWGASSSARAEADRIYRQLLAADQGKSPISYAYAVVLMKQRRYDDALKTLDAVLKADAGDVPARENKIRLLMLQKNFDAALVEIDALSRIATKATDEQLSAERKREVAGFLGRMFGYLEGPGRGDVADAALDRAQREVERRLADEETTAYEQARDAVLTRYGEMTGESQRGRQEALADKEKQRDEARRDLDQQREQQQTRRAELIAQGDKLRKEIQVQEAAYAQADRPLLDRLGLLDRQAAVPRREVALLVNDAANLRAAAARTQDRFDRDRLLFRAQELEIVASRYDADLAALERQAAAVNAERARLQDRYQRDVAALAANLQGIDKELDLLTRGEKRLAVDEKRLGKPLTSGTRAVRSLEANANAFTTYEPLPLEEERQRLLDAATTPRN